MNEPNYPRFFDVCAIAILASAVVIGLLSSAQSAEPFHFNGSLIQYGTLPDLNSATRKGFGATTPYFPSPVERSTLENESLRYEIKGQ